MDAAWERNGGERAKQLRLLPNDLPFLSNGVTIQVSSTDGHITAYNLNWSEVKAPEVKGVINLDQAQQAFVKASLLKLEYWMPALYKPLLAGRKQEVKLVYQLTGQNGGAIDAFTGEPLQLAQGERISADSSVSTGIAGGQGLKASKGSDEAISLSPQEQQEIANTANLLKRDEAIAAVRRWIDIQII